MNATEIVKTFVTALQSGDMETATAHMSDDFICSGWTPQPLDKEQFLAMQSALLNAMPDYSYNLSEVSKVQNEKHVVEAFIQITGTHTNELTLPMLGMPPIPATGLAVTLPQVKTKYLIEDSKVAQMSIGTVPGGGLAGLLQQVGSELTVRPREDS